MSRRHNRPDAKGKRSSRFIEPHKVVRIYCNGEVTEKFYFQSLIADLRLNTDVKVIPKTHNRVSLVKEVTECMGRDGAGVDQVWVVFDVDAAPKGKHDPGKIKDQANQAVKQCEKKKYRAIVSNDSFELWFLLHYKKDFVPRHRDDLAKQVSKLISEKYEKATPMYDRLKPMQDQAIAHARELCSQYGTKGTNEAKPVSQCEPYTNVHELVEALKIMNKSKCLPRGVVNTSLSENYE